MYIYSHAYFFPLIIEVIHLTTIPYSCALISLGYIHFLKWDCGNKHKDFKNINNPYYSKEQHFMKFYVQSISLKKTNPKIIYFYM